MSGVLRAVSLAGAILAAGAAGLDTTGDQVIDHVKVPSADKPQGEVRIVRRNGRPVVQTLLHTKVLKRVIGAIADKERRGWPARTAGSADVAGYADSQRYLAVLDEFARKTLAERDKTGSPTERHVQALIEFVDEPGHPFVAIGSAQIDATGESLRLVSRGAPTVLEVSAEYLRQDMKLIVADSFHISPDEAGRRLAAVVVP